MLLESEWGEIDYLFPIFIIVAKWSGFDKEAFRFQSKLIYDIKQACTPLQKADIPSEYSSGFMASARKSDRNRT